MKAIPFVDLAGQHAQCADGVKAAIEEVMSTSSFIGGRRVADFEAAFVRELGLEDGVGCSSGTSALSLALEALGVGPGDEVVTTAHTFIATAEAICHRGATPVFAEIEPGSYSMDPESVAAVITPRTRAIVAVHLYGVPVDMPALGALAQRYGLVLLEDAAQAHGAKWAGRPVGALGDMAAFSFYPGKNLGAIGDAGFVAGRTDLVAAIRSLVDHGRVSKYEHDRVGYNHRLDALQAAVLSVKLPLLRRWNAHRRQVAACYDEALRGAGFKTIEAPPEAEPVYHLYVVEVSNREDVLAHLARQGIAAGIHYPVPLHLQPALRHLGLGPGALPGTEAAASRVVSLPIDGVIGDDAVVRVTEAFLEVARP